MNKLTKYFKIVWDNYSLSLFFSLAIFSKLLLFNFLNNVWPSNETLLSFTLYTTATTGIFIVPALFIREKQRLYLLIVDFIVTTILLADSLYIHFFDTLPVISLLGVSGQLSSDIGKWFGSLISIRDIYLVVDFIAIACYHKFKKSKKSHKSTELKVKTMPIYINIILALAPFILLVTLIGTDLQGRLPYLYGQISENKVVAKNIGLFGAHVMDISRNFVGLFDTLTPEQKADTLKVIKDNSAKLAPNPMTGIAKDKRIIMIQVESLNDFTIGAKVNGQELTPNLNKLKDNSNYFANDYFTVGAGGTSDADFSINSSLYPLTDSSVFVKYSKDNFTSLEKELKSNGYSTNAYHANSRGYWNRNTVFKSLGFDNFFAEDNFTPGTEINMGLSDKDFLRQSFAILKTQPVNSLNYLITLSSHFSFGIPNKEKTLNIPKGKYTSLTTDYFQSIHYTDSAIGEFIDNLKTGGMYDDSLIVLYGDHTAKYDPFTDDAGNESDLGTTSGKRIPLFIKLPGETAAKKSSTPSSHLDIMPTILNLVGAKTTSPMLGRDLFAKSQPFFFTDAFENDFEQIISGKIKYLNNGTTLDCYNYDGKKNNIVDISICDPLLDKRNTIQNAVNKLIKYNLFRDYLKK